MSARQRTRGNGLRAADIRERETEEEAGEGKGSPAGRTNLRESLLFVAVFVWLVLVITVFMAQPFVSQIVNVFMHLALNVGR